MIPQKTSCELTVIADIGSSEAAVDALENSLGTTSRRQWELLRLQATGSRPNEIAEMANGWAVLVIDPKADLTDSTLDRIMWLLEADTDLAAVAVYPTSDGSNDTTSDAEMFLLRTVALEQIVTTHPDAVPTMTAENLARTAEMPGLPILRVERVPGPDHADESPYPFSSSELLIPRNTRIVDPLGSNRRRLLAIFPWMAVGGADRYNLDVLRSTTAAGWDLTIATTDLNSDSWEPEFKALTSDIHKLSRLTRSLDYPSYVKNLLVTRAPDAVLISNSEAGYQLLPYMRRWAPDATFVDLVHAEQPEWKDGGYARYSALYRDHLDLTIAVSDHLAEWISTAGTPAERISVCRAGVDPAWWAPALSKRSETLATFGLDPTSIVATFSGRLTPQKQPDVFLEAVAYANRDGARCSAFVLGDGEMRSQLVSQAAGLGVSAAIVGAVSPETVRSILQATDIALLTSQAEGIAISLLEAMSCGIPVISANVGGQAELVTPDCGDLLDPSNHDEEVIRYGAALAALARDAGRRRRLGEASRRRIVESFSVERTGARFVELIVSAATGHQADPRPPVPQSHADLSASTAIGYLQMSRYAADLQNSIKGLHEANTWLTGQADAWEQESARLTSQIAELKSWIGELEAGKQWLEGQVEAWKVRAQQSEER